MNTMFYSEHGRTLFAGIFVLLFACAPATVRRNISTITITKTHFMEIRNTDSVTIYWNAPPWDPDTVLFYKLIYHTARDTNWTLVKDSIPPSPSPQLVVHRNEVSSADSLFYFGVKYMSGDGIESSIHASLDSTANPPGGWFMLWTK